MAKLVAEAVKVLLYRVPADVVDNEGAFNSFLTEISGLAAQWKEMVTEFEGEKDDFHEILEALVTVWKCAHSEERRRPDATAVRAARKCLLVALRGGGPLADIAKAMSFEGAKVVMNMAKGHAAAGIEDDAATARWTSASSQLEQSFGHGFDDPFGWLATGAGGRPLGLVDMIKVLDALNIFFGDFSMCVQRWSTAGLQDHKEEIIDSIGNGLSFASMANFVMVRVASLGFVTHSFGPPDAEPVQPPAEGDEMPTADDVREEAAAEEPGKLSGAQGSDGPDPEEGTPPVTM